MKVKHIVVNKSEIQIFYLTGVVTKYHFLKPGTFKIVAS